jgi:hypothetical protein
MAMPFCDFKNLTGFAFYSLSQFIKTNPNPNSERRRFTPPLTIWVLCPNKNGDSYNGRALSQIKRICPSPIAIHSKELQRFVNMVKLG